MKNVTNVTVSTMLAAIEAFEHFFDNEWRIPDIGTIQVDNFFRVNIYADNGKWYKYDPDDESITEHTNNWRH